jgi:uncharacterized protein (TIGR02646 family)
MIYVHRSWEAIPVQVKEDLKAAALALDDLQDAEARREFIKVNAPKWAAVREYLRDMSSGKCWYSEARESVSRYQVDHYRPHGRAKQALKTFAEGYSWLAFDLDNFRLAGVLCNTVNQEYSEDTIGKGDWFPLFDPAVRACLASRDFSKESPILLDPVDPDDPYKLVFQDDGSVHPDPDMAEAERSRVQSAIEYLGLSQSQLNRARRKTWRDCFKRAVKYNRIAKKPKGARTAEECETLDELTGELIAMSKAKSEFASVARCCLKANRLSKFVVADELAPLGVD